MAGYLICVCYESGVPIFARKVGDVNPIPFPLAASLNGVKVFGKANRVELMSTLTQSSRIVWKDFHDRLSMILAATDDSVTDMHLENVLENIFNILVLNVGLNDIMGTKSIDVLKKEFRMCYPVIDLILQGIKPSEHTLYFSDLTMCADVALQIESTVNYQGVLDSFLEGTGVSYGCIIANGCILASSRDWWVLSGKEISLLTFTTEQVTEASIDSPVFLPVSSPKLPYRHVVFKLTDNVRLCILCGQEPTMSLLEKEAHKLRKANLDSWTIFNDKTVPFCLYNRFFTIDESISAFLVINVEKERAAFSIFPDKPNDVLTPRHKLDLLRTFYRNTVGSVFPWNKATAPTFTSPAHPDAKDTEPVLHRAQECYWSSEYHKCHAIKSSHVQLYVMYDSQVFPPTMRQCTRKLLQELLKDRMIKL
ncbi:unnamed protein product [Orchesella dallaii]|uniref:Protein fuzzy n=1 Tax=Orchesella dallaii TaxID=48710 RepID=A0ABP1Q486_9HEXA